MPLGLHVPSLLEFHEKRLHEQSLQVRFSKNTHKLDIFNMQTTAKRDDISMSILKVSTGQDLGTQL